MEKPAPAVLGISRLSCSLLLCATFWTQTAIAQEKAPAADMVVTMASGIRGTHPDALGGVSVDRLGYTYVADFGQMVWKISPHGEVEEFARGFYGAAGNAIDSQGNLLQVNHYAGTVVKIGRWGGIETVISGLQSPLGIALDFGGHSYVTQCGSNSIMVDGQIRPFATSKLFDCPVGLVWAGANLYVVNRNNGIVAKVDATHAVSEHARIPEDSAAGIAYGRGNLFVTSAAGNRIYRVNMDGEVELLAGNGERGIEEGLRLEAKLSRPSGIAYSDGLILFNGSITDLGAFGASRSYVALQKIRLRSISDVLLIASASEKVEDLRRVYREYLADPAHRKEPNETEVDELADRLLRSGSVEMSRELLRLNAESNSKSWQAQARLGASLAAAGETEKAVRAYRRSLKLNPENESARRAVADLRRKR